VLKPWDRERLPDLLGRHGVAGLPEEPFPNDGWSGAQLTLIRRGGDRFVLKRTSWATDWIARSTRDHAVREAFVAAGGLRPPAPLWPPYLGAAADGNAAAILMPDLSDWLVAWDRPGGATLEPAALWRIVDAVAELHLAAWPDETAEGAAWPWCPLQERLELLTRRSAERYHAAGLAVGGRFVAGWDVFDRLASASGRELVERLSRDSAPLLKALERLPSTGLHGDLKLANVGLLPDGRVALIDWQLMCRAPVAVELGWLLVSNSGSLVTQPEILLERYRAAVAARLAEAPKPGSEPLSDPILDWDGQVDLTWIVGLLLRGWRKGLDAAAGAGLPSGAAATDDLALWCRRAVDAADRRL
jgi:aminoglycoside phosphotransferase (APT) family kinase protein